jgi:hypothetical protein
MHWLHAYVPWWFCRMMTSVVQGQPTRTSTCITLSQPLRGCHTASSTCYAAQNSATAQAVMCKEERTGCPAARLPLDLRTSRCFSCLLQAGADNPLPGGPLPGGPLPGVHTPVRLQRSAGQVALRQQGQHLCYLSASWAWQLCFHHPCHLRVSWASCITLPINCHSCHPFFFLPKLSGQCSSKRDTLAMTSPGYFVTSGTTNATLTAGPNRPCRQGWLLREGALPTAALRMYQRLQVSGFFREIC